MFKSFILIFTLVLGAAAQENNTPILVDEFKSLGCCDFRSRIDVFLGELASNPTNIGVVVTGGPREDVVRKVLREEMTRSHLDFRNFDRARVRFVRAEAETVSTQLWRVPVGSAMPDLHGVDNTYSLDFDTPTLVLTDYPYGDGGLCPATEDREMFALFLAANPTSRAKVVIRGHSRRESNTIEMDLTRFFVSDAEIDRTRLQFAVVRQTDGAGFGPSVEYWYRP